MAKWIFLGGPISQGEDTPPYAKWHYIPFDAVNEAISNASDSIDINNQQIKNAANPVSPQDVATKSYVDNTTVALSPSISSLRSTVAANSAATQLSWQNGSAISSVNGDIVAVSVRVYYLGQITSGVRDYRFDVLNSNGVLSIIGSIVLSRANFSGDPITPTWQSSVTLSGNNVIVSVTPPVNEGGVIWADLLAEKNRPLMTEILATPNHQLISGVSGNIITLTGFGTNWDSNTVFSASTGVIVSTSILSSTSATLTYIAGAVGTVIFTDLSSGAIYPLTILQEATTYTLNGPTSGTFGQESTNFTVQLAGMLSNSTIITPSDGGAGGSFSPISITLSAYVLNASSTFTYTPISSGQVSIATINNRWLTNPTSLTYTVPSDINLTIPASTESSTVSLTWSKTQDITAVYVSQVGSLPDVIPWLETDPLTFDLVGDGYQTLYYWGRNTLGHTARKSTTILVIQTNPPVISDIVSMTSLTQAVVSWTTDKLATSVVEYGITASYGASVNSQSLTTNHSVVINGLEPGITYHYRCLSQDASGNNVIGNDNLLTMVTEGVINFVSASSITLSSGQTTTQVTHDGSLLIVGVSVVGDTAPTVIWNGSVMGLITQRGSGWGQYAYLFALPGADAGTHELVINISAASGHAYIASYSGTPYDATMLDSAATDAGVSPITLTTSVVSSKSWLIGFVVGGDIIFQGGANTTIRGTADAFGAIGDSNGIIGTGNQSLIFNGGTGGQSAGVIISVIVGDVAAPLIIDLNIYRAQDSVTFTWTTDEPATSIIEYGPTISYGQSVSNTNLTISHDVVISALEVDTQYHFRITSSDAAENARTTSDYVIRTTLPDLSPPIISDINISYTDIKAVITWTTDEPSTSTIEYGLTSGYGLVVSSTSLVTNHSVIITGLTASTTYHYQIKSQDAHENEVASIDREFTTEIVDVIAPIISGITVSVSDTTATITWNTDEESTSSVQFGPTTNYGSSYFSSEFTTQHSINLIGLEPGTLYNFRVISTDPNENTSVVTNQTFTTSTSALRAYTPQGIGGGGAMSSLSFSPIDSNLLFVATDMGSLWRSYNRGETWQAIDQIQIVYNAELGYSAPLGFCADPNIVLFANIGRNPLRSVDKGLNWTAIYLPLEGNEHIQYWVPDTTNENVILCATDQRLFKSTNKGINWSELSISGPPRGTFFDHLDGYIYHATPSGIYVSQDDGVTFNLHAAPDVLPLRAFAGGRDGYGLTLVYVDGDGVNAVGPWIQALIGINEATQANYNNSVATSGFVWVSSPNEPAFHRIEHSQTYSGIGVTSSYLYSCGEIRLAGQAPYASLAIDGYGLGCVWMAENDSQTIWATGSIYWPRMYGTKTFISTNAGQTWEKVFQIADADNDYDPWPADKLEWNPIGMGGRWWDAFYTSFSVNQCDSGVAGGTGYMFVHTTKNQGATWQAPFTKHMDVEPRTLGQRWRSTGLEQTSICKIRFHTTNTLLMYMGTADIGGFASEDGGQTIRILGNIGNTIYDFAFDTNNDQVVYGVSSSQHDWPEIAGTRVVIDGSGGVFRSADRGRTWTRLTPSGGEFDRSFLSVAYDSVRGIVYGGSHGNGIARSTDGGNTWTWYNSGIYEGQGRIIASMTTDANGNVYALLTGDFVVNGQTVSGTNQAYTGIYYLDVENGATSWVLLRGTVHLRPEDQNPANYWVYPTTFAIDPTNPNVLWLADIEGGWGDGGAWKSTNRGQDWYHQVQCTRSFDLAIDLASPNNVYLAASFQIDGGWGNGGHMYTADGGNTWNVNNRLPYKISASAVVVDPNNNNNIWYGFHGAALLYGPKPDPNVVIPTIPTITATAISSTSIRVSWTGSTSDVPIKGYTIRRSYNDGAFHDIAITYAGPNDREFIDVGLPPGNSFRYSIRAEDIQGDLSGFGFSVPVQPDAIAPIVTSFTIAPTSSSRTIDIVSFTATDASGVTGYMITESATTPLANSINWTALSPASYTVNSDGYKVLYAWAKDALNNISVSVSAAVTVTTPDTIAPVITEFVIPSEASSYSISISTFTATDEVGVTGYLVNESSTPPLASDPGWLVSAPASYTVNSDGYKVLYAWAKDAANNISQGVNANVLVRTDFAVAFVDVSPQITLSLNPTFSFTNNGTLLLVGVTGQFEAPSVSWNNNPMSLIASRSSDWGQYAHLYYIAGADTGTHDIVVNGVSSGWASAVSYSGTALDSSAIIAFNTGVASGANPLTLSMTVGDGYWVVGYGVGGNEAFTAVAPAVARGTPTAMQIFGDSNGTVSAGQYSITFNGGGGASAGVIVSIR